MLYWKISPYALGGIVLISAPMIAHAKIYVTAEQAQKILFPNTVLSKAPLLITEDLQEKMRIASSIRHPFQGDRIWKTVDGAWFIVDEVVGKHEMITYAVGINPSGRILGIEILEYVESYGYEVAQADWRKQFVGKSAKDPIKLNQDIQNIGGATLSCKHLTDGVKRVTALYELALKSK
ncbi:FMN-binding protein [Polynucleobacter sp. UK-Kesae-W10]|uniref:FMN-binding protein n=1 Tax=Polynucleobacter sp. UK-Kesae-W10 TaxID=1819738 RepID=UPI0021053D25|nr:FMN-binding protein [Polynucleobacter sp. UK-Kesae-W10]MBU3576985.1 FMN-binding protein [Polynucleobacter sp. UK-Kesae-W10]